jgi:predicted outer membrane repeat protein
MYNHTSSSLVLTGVTISVNSAGDGGGIYNHSSSLVLTNVSISGNSAGEAGGGIYNQDSSPKIRNNVIWVNTAATSAGIDGFGSVIRYSIVQDSSYSGTPDAEGNMNIDPLFESLDPASGTLTTTGGNYRLKTGSPAINTGSGNNYPETWSKWQTLIGTGGAINSEAQYDDYITPYIGKDLAGNTRILGPVIDMGAYEKE